MSDILTLYKIQNPETGQYWAGIRHIYRDGRTTDVWDSAGLTFASPEDAKRAIKQRPAWYEPLSVREYTLVGFELHPTSSETVKLAY